MLDLLVLQDVNYLVPGKTYPQLPEEPIPFQARLLYFFYYKMNHVSGELLLASKAGFIGLGVYDCSKYLMLLFGDPAMNIMAEGYKITHDITLEEEATISNMVEVDSSSTLTVANNCHLYFQGIGGFNILEGSSLIINNNASFDAIDEAGIIEVSGNMEVNGLAYFGIDIRVKNGGVLNIANDQTLEFQENAAITIDSGGTLIIEDNATIKGRNSSNKIVVNGTLQPGNNLSFEPVFYMEFWEGLELNTPNASCNLGSPSFTNCGISGDCKTLTLSSASFNKGNVFITAENTAISNSTFNNGFISIDHPGGRPSTGINISGCSISNVNDDDARGAILINGHPEFVISNNTPLQNFPSPRSRSCYC